MNLQIELDERIYELNVSPYGRYDDDIQLDVESVVDEEGNDVTDETLTDRLLDRVYDRYSERIYEEWYMHKVGEAEAYWEGDR